MARALWLASLAGLLIVSAGCGTLCERRPLCCRDNAPKPVFVPPPPPSPVFQPGPQIQQSGAFPIASPPPGAVIKPAPGLPPSISNAPPPISNAPPPKVDTQLNPGAQQGPRDVPPRIQLYAPEPIDKDKPADDPLLKKPNIDRSFPAIPQFAKAGDRVYAGLRPPLDGLDWLRQDGVKTVVQVRLFGEDDSAVRKAVESRGMRYVAFEVSPVALTKEKADEFIKLVRDGAKDGIFVYDEDGSLAGSMWYLFLRLGEVIDDEPAQIRARGLGLQNAREGQHLEMWLAVQKLLSER